MIIDKVYKKDGKIYMNTGIWSGVIIGEYVNLDNLSRAALRIKKPDSGLPSEEYYFENINREKAILDEILNSDEYKKWIEQKDNETQLRKQK